MEETLSSQASRVEDYDGWKRFRVAVCFQNDPCLLTLARYKQQCRRAPRMMACSIQGV